MRVLKMVTITLIVCGCWQPESWTSPSKTVLYRAYSVIIISMTHWVTFCELMDILLYVETQDEFADNFYIFVSMLVGCQKIVNLLLTRKNVAGLLNTFEEEPFAPRNQEERDVRSRFDKTMHTNTILYTCLLTTSCSIFSVSVFFKSEKWPLVFRAWLPYNYSTVGLYLPTVIQQSVALQYGAFGHVACDALLCGLMVHMCSQFEILRRRLSGIKRGEIGAVKSCVCCHDRLCRYAKEMNKQFKVVISLQFLASVVVVCFNLYRLTKSVSLGSKLPVLLMYSVCIMSQIFIYCWYGNEVKLKSIEVSDVIYSLNWTDLDEIQRKMILMMLCRTATPIEFSGAHVATLNLESYVNILKTSYSAYNVLQ